MVKKKAIKDTEENDRGGIFQRNSSRAAIVLQKDTNMWEMDKKVHL